ncbi:hypothetical protein SY83_10455 [Paenibacillus swuensis]|uniref:NOMO second beta-sandwich domain-containing protein n=1 Tax=Paenibacillus swuensis TaxID=1178515 RepID=A0A172TI29_9BACL|nr:carboxypeptidase regulatory-like domain-containing protein [Paenibacillus swuensis]ANE46622.1 hypothetical protein SY83_10455 [Paenibacillus swuensis]
MTLFPGATQFTPLTLKGAPLFDPPLDENPSSVDIVGDASFPSAYIAYDGTHVFFRLRLRTDPRFKTAFQNFTWGVLLNTATSEWQLSLDGNKSRLNLIPASAPKSSNADDAASFSQPVINYDIARAILAPDGSSLGKTPNYFLDFTLPSAILFKFLGITEASPLQCLFFTATNSNNINKDVLSTSFSDPFTLTSVNLRAVLNVSKTLQSGPTQVNTNQITRWQGTITARNSGKSQATTVFVNDVFGLNQITSLGIDKPTIGNATVDAIRNTITWNIGNLLPGQSTSLTFNVTGQFTAPPTGTPTLNTATVTGIDLFTGSRVPTATATIDLAVITSGGISGQVVNGATGLPVPFTNVALRAASGTFTAATVSDVGGGFGFSNLAAGSYILDFTAAGFQNGTATVTVAAGTAAKANIILQPVPAIVQGTVSNPITGAIPDAQLRLKDPFGAIVASTVSAATGFYNFPNVRPGSYILTVEANGFETKFASITTTSGTVLTSDFSLTANPASVSGFVLNKIAGTVIPGALVEVINGVSNVLASTLSDASGFYSINSLPPGTFGLRASSPGFGTVIVAFTVTPGEKEALNVDLLANEGSVVGVITDAETGAPLPETSIRIVASDGVTLVTGLTDALGQYNIASLPPDFYNINFAVGGYSTRTLGVSIEPGVVSRLDTALSRLAGTLVIRITGTDQQPIQNAFVRVYNGSTIIGFTTSDQEGIVTYPSIAPNTYTIAASAAGFGTLLSGTIIQPGETSSLELVLEPNPGFLRGQVRSATGVSVPGAVVTIRSESAQGPIVFKSIADSNGLYFVPSLAPGDYAFIAVAASFQTSFSGGTIRSDETTRFDFTLSPNPGVIEGYIFNNQTNAPLTEESSEVRILNQFGVVVGNVFTDQNGMYRTPGLAPGNYDIVVSAANFQTGMASSIVEQDGVTVTNLSLLPNPGIVRGRISESVTDLPIGSAVVQALGENGNLIATTLTDPEGNYQVTGLAPGNYTIIATAKDLQSNVAGGIVISGLTTVISFTLTPIPGTIQGTVLPGALGLVIQLYNSSNLFLSVVASPDGQFQFKNLTPGNYIVSASAPNFAIGTAAVTVPPGGEGQILITLTPNPATLSGRITSINGLPIVNALVKIQDDNDNLIGLSGTDANGLYSINNLPPGNYSITVTAPSFMNTLGGIRLNPGDAVSGRDFTLSPNSGSISGQITKVSDGSVISGASITLRPTDIAGTQIKNTTTSPFGNFLLSDLSPGSYVLFVSAPMLATQEIGVIVISDEIARADVALSSIFGGLSGLVTDPQGTPIPGAGIKLQDPAGNLITNLLSNSDGTFLLDQLTPGNVALTITAERFQANSFAAVIEAGKIVTITASLTGSPAVLSGRVLNALSLAGIDGSFVSVKNEAGIAIATVVSGRDGEFLLNQLPPGSFQCTAIADNFGAVSVGIILKAGEVTTTSLRLVPNPGFITGFVSSSPDGNPIPGASIQILNSAGAVITTLLSDSQGAYLSEGLQSDSYTAVSQAQGFTSQRIGFQISPGVTQSLSFLLAALPATITGIISDSRTGLPLSNAFVELRDANTFGDAILRAVSEQDGTYELTGVYSGNFTLTALSPGYQTVVTSTGIFGGERQVFNFPLPPVASTITGVVTGPSTSGGTVSILPMPGVPVKVIDSFGVTVSQGQTDLGGNYVAGGLPSDQYTIVAATPSLQYGLQQVTLLSGKSAITNFSLAANPSSFAGTVLEQSSSTPVVGAIVQVINGNRIPVIVTATDGVGRFEASGLSAGQYTIQISAPQFGSTATVQSVGTGIRPPDLQLELNTAPGNLAGTVRDEQFRPLYRALVQVFQSDQALLRQVITNFQGKYAIFGLAPGTYLVQFSYPDKITQLRQPLIRSFETTILDVIMPEEAEE